MGLSKEEKLILKQKRMQNRYNEKYKTLQGILYKKCPTCTDFHPCNEDYFYRHSKTTDGFYFECKNCRGRR